MRNRAVRGCLILLPLLVSAATLAKSNNPSPSPPEIRKPEQPKPGEPETPAQKNQDRTAISPLIIKEAPTPKAQKEPAENTKETDSKTSTDWWMVWLTGILAFVASLQLIVFGLQARRLRQTIETMKKIGADQSRDMQSSIGVAKESADAARDSIKLAEDTAKRQLRAYLCQGAATISNFGENLEPIVHVRIVNRGQTPAYNVKASCSVGIDVFPMTSPPPQLPPREPTQVVIGPIGEITISTPVKNRLRPADIYRLGLAEISMIKCGKWAIYAIGKVTYIDAFGQDRFTDFRLFHSGDSFADPGGNMACDKTGNDAN